MAVFKIIGTIIRTVQAKESGGQRKDIALDNQYRLVRINGIKPVNQEPEAYKLGMSRSIRAAAVRLGFLPDSIRSDFVCNDSESTDALPIDPVFNAAEIADKNVWLMV